MELAKRDSSIAQMKQELENRRKYLVNKAKEVHEVSRENLFLVDVAKDYMSVLGPMRREKEAQIKALEELSSYISQVTSDINESEHLLDQSRQQQTELRREIESIQGQLREMI
jgi:methyl-accepting chemotaxis protein